MPQIWHAARSGRSLMRALGALPVAPEAPLFLTPRDGLGRLVAAAVEQLVSDGVLLVPEKAAGPVRRVHDRVELGPGLDFDAVVLAVSPRSAATLLGGDAAATLEDVATVSVTMLIATLSGVELPKGVNGFVAEPADRRLLTACSFASNKWPHWSDPGTPLVRISAGRTHDERISGMSDDEVTDRLVGDLSRALGPPIEPVAVRVVRWPNGFPQYRSGHLAAMRALQEHLDREQTGVALAGSAFGGIGIPACIASGRRAAARVVDSLRTRTARRG
jgi:oxygen-dependent protoporphyrinogen oxidase